MFKQNYLLHLGWVLACALVFMGPESVLAQKHGGGGGGGRGGGGGGGGGRGGSFSGGHVAPSGHSAPSGRSFAPGSGARPGPSGNWNWSRDFHDGHHDHHGSSFFFGFYPGFYPGFGWDYGYYPGYYGYPWGYRVYGDDPGYYYYDPAPGAVAEDYQTEAPAPAPDNRAHVLIRTPTPDTEVWIEDEKMTETGRTREYQSPILEGGKNYTYEMKARWKENGTEYAQTRKFPVHANDRVIVIFGKTAKDESSSKTEAGSKTPQPMPHATDG